MNTLKALFCIILMFSQDVIFSQEVECTRAANLTGSTVYNTQGTAFLEEYTSGELKLRLGEDFLADVGPDVQIFLSNDSTSVAGGIMIADIGQSDGLNHFSGTMSFDIPEGTLMDTYSYIVFRCITFSAYWGGGKLSAPSCGNGPNMPMDSTGMMPMDSTGMMPMDSTGMMPMDSTGMMPMDSTGMMPTCIESLVATTDWASEVTICPNDGIADAIELRTNIDVELDENYSFLITDVNNNLLEVVDAQEYNFEGTSLETQYVFGVYYRGELSFSIGSPISMIMADTCALLSSSTVFLTVNKTNCATSFDCVETVTATTNWVDELDICPSDNSADLIPFINNQAQEAGDNFAYVVTDSLFSIQNVLSEASFDFEGSGESTQLILGVSYSGELDYTIGDPFNTITADSCFALSDTTRFLTITKNACISQSTERSVSGQVTNNAGVGIAGVTIRTSGNLSTTTDASGAYILENLPTDQELTITAERTTDASNGISAIDIILVRRHILGIEPFTNPLQLIAADVNDNQSVSAIDLVEIQRVLLDLSSEFAAKSSWQFVDAATQLNSDILSTGVTPSISISQGTSDLNNINFIGVKTGDVNESANPN